MNTYILKNGNIMVSNNGYDKKEKPFIPIEEFYLDIWNGIKIVHPNNMHVEFNKIICEIMLKEIRFLPKRMKSICIVKMENMIKNKTFN